MSVAALQTDKKLTPMMAQYETAKRDHPDCLLFFRMGDFFELFYEDAEAASAALDIALTKRQETPMCGVPVHAYENYLAKLIRAGFKVAICDQLESPEEARARDGYKALVRRGVIRIVTPGTLTEATLLDTRRANYLAALASYKNGFALAWCDISTGAFHVQETADKEVKTALARINASELLLSPGAALAFPELKEVGSVEEERNFDVISARKKLQERFEVLALDGFGQFSDPCLAAAGALLSYIERTQNGQLPLLNPPRLFHAHEAVIIDASTLKNLEIFESTGGNRKDGLLACLDNTKTSAGGRLLAERLASPSQNLEEINRRLDEIDVFENMTLRKNMRQTLTQVPDAERALSRLGLNRAGPRDLAIIRALGQSAAAIRIIMNTVQDGPAALDDLRTDLNSSLSLSALVDILELTLTAEPPLLAREGGFIKNGYRPALDEALRLRDDARKIMAELQARYVMQTGMNSLKISYNAIIGYHIDISAKQASPLLEIEARQDPLRSMFIHRQTLANNVRFTTEELLDLEQKISKAGETAIALELEIFDELRKKILTQADDIKHLVHTLARLDIASAMADLANTRKYTRPVLSEDARFYVKAGRHPVVEQALQSRGGRFDPNDCALNDGERLWLITGPNMAGKSTFLRQNALITLMAQAGMYVPAVRAEIGIVDRIFSRVGAGDDLSSGRSTFMVEMTETALILNQATQRSLVIVDEIGRGTATQDGLALARACLEYFHDSLKCRGLFATHFHELVALENSLQSLACYNLAVREQGGQIYFLHRVEKGSADRSFGVHVAKLAGLPATVVKRAQDILRILEKGQKASPDLPLFDAAPTAQPEVEQHPALTMLDDIDPDAMSPKDALEALYKLKNL